MRPRRVLITGSEGFVGRAFQRWFARNGGDAEWDLHCLDIKPDRHGRPGIDCRRVFGGTQHPRFDLVVHLAAIVGGRVTIEGDQLAVATDLAIDADFFAWCRRNRPAHAIYFSSSAAYPIALQNQHHDITVAELEEPVGRIAIPYQLREADINLEDIHQPDLTYGLAKLVGEIQARLVREEGVDVRVFRPFSGYGADQDRSYPAPAIVERAARREDPLSVWSDAVRDFIHIDDVVSAVMVSLAPDVPYTGPVNLCTGRATSFSAFARLAADVVGYEPEVTVLSGKPKGVAYRVGDPTEMLRFYTPQITLERGLEQMAHVAAQEALR